MSKRRVGLLLMIIGVLALAAGLGLGGYNLWDNYRAGVQADSILSVIVHHQTEANVQKAPLSPEFPPDTDQELSVLEVDGYRYIGMVSVPVIDLELPVQESWSLAQLKISPCRYMGSPYQGNLIICAHNYTTHFGRLQNLLPGDDVIFTDMEGNEFRYTVVELENLAGTAIEEMESGMWDLTLFTCTLGGQARVTVRCKLLEKDESAVNRVEDSIINFPSPITGEM